MRFRIEDVYSITGLGCVAVGMMEVGSIRVTDSLRVTPGPGSTSAPALVTVGGIEAHRKELSVAPPGERVGLVLRAVSPGSWGHRYDLRKGDLLTTP